MSIHTPPAPSLPLPSGIKDEGALYRLSGMVDAVRDEAHELLPARVSPTTLTRMVVRYTALRAALADQLEPHLATEMLDWSEDLAQAPVGSVDEVFDAAMTLARWVDLLLQMPGFVVGRRTTAAELREQWRALNDAEAEEANGQSGPRGQYL